MMQGNPNAEQKRALKPLIDRLMDMRTAQDPLALESEEDIRAKRARLREELGLALWRWSDSIDHAARIVGHVVGTSHWRPSPAELRDQAASVTPNPATAPRADCARCGGRGFISVDREVTAGVFTYTAAVSKECECRKTQESVSA